MQSLEMELQYATRRVWEELESQAGIPYGAPVPGGSPEKGHIQEAEPRDTWEWPECGQGSIRVCYLMFS